MVTARKNWEATAPNRRLKVQCTKSITPEEIVMSTSLVAKFDTRREAEMTVERLVQQFKIERTDVFITTEGEDNTVGVELAGSDTEAGEPSPPTRHDAELAGRVVVSVDINDDSLVEEVRSAFTEFDASDIENG
jgi:hypothetical protein